MCFFMNGWKGVRLGRLGICCVKKKKRKEMFFEKYTLLFDTSFSDCLVFQFLFLPTKSNLDAWI